MHIRKKHKFKMIRFVNNLPILHALRIIIFMAFKINLKVKIK